MLDSTNAQTVLESDPVLETVQNTAITKEAILDKYTICCRLSTIYNNYVVTSLCFTKEELLLATNDLRVKLGCGGFGKVYLAENLRSVGTKAHQEKIFLILKFNENQLAPAEVYILSRCMILSNKIPQLYMSTIRISRYCTYMYYNSSISKFYRQYTSGS